MVTYVIAFSDSDWRAEWAEEILDEYMDGTREIYDEDGEVVPVDEITEELARAAALEDADECPDTYLTDEGTNADPDYAKVFASEEEAEEFITRNYPGRDPGEFRILGHD